MTTPEKAKGDAFEREVAAYLKANGFDKARRLFGAGTQNDIGDITGIDLFTIECKSQNRMDLAEWVDQGERQRRFTTWPFSVVIARRRRKPIGQAYVVHTLDQFIEIARRLTADAR